MKQNLIEKYLTPKTLNETNYIVKYKAKNKKGKVIEKEKKIKATSDKAASAMAKRDDKNYYDSISVKKLDESSGTGGSSELWFGSWSRPLLIYMQEDEVLFSYNHEFPPGYKMTEDDIERARARGFILVPV